MRAVTTPVLCTSLDDCIHAGFPVDAGLWVKRDDLTSDVYGGNKVRKLELLFGAARDAGKTRIEYRPVHMNTLTRDVEPIPPKARTY